jgi:hypothetical protein
MKPIDFGRGRWDAKLFYDVYSPKFASTPRFEQQDDCLVNAGAPGHYDYVSIVTKQLLPLGVKLETRCSFERYGAPLIVLSDDLRRDEAGVLRYGEHYEIVAYEGGVNIWHLRPLPGDVQAENLIRRHFSVAAGMPFTLGVCPTAEGFAVRLEEESFFLPVRGLPARFHAGVTACEGIDRFYAFAVDRQEGDVL